MNEFKQLLKIMEILRDPLKGCPWDKVQTKESLKEYVVEEAYELIEALDNKNIANINEELGDLLLQIVFISQIMKESGESSISEVINTLIQKLIRRHPHIFSDKKANTPEEVKNNWESIKKSEKGSNSILSDYPEAMPALASAKRYGDQASSVGFDWGDPGPARCAAPPPPGPRSRRRRSGSRRGRWSGSPGRRGCRRYTRRYSAAASRRRPCSAGAGDSRRPTGD